MSLCNVNNEFIYCIGGENRYESLLDAIERYNINFDVWELVTIRMPIKIECVACVYHNNNEIVILGGYSSETGSSKSIYHYDINNNIIRKSNKELPQPGWVIYPPIKNGNILHIFYGGEENFPPQHLIYEL